MCPSYPMTPRTRRPRRRAVSASRPASDGLHPQRGQTDVHVDDDLARLPRPQRPPPSGVRIDGHGHPGSCADEAAEPVGVDHLVGQEEIVAETGASHALHLGDGRAGEPVMAVRRLALDANEVHLWAFTWGRRRGPGRAAAMVARLSSRRRRLDHQSRGRRPTDLHRVVTR